ILRRHRATGGLGLPRPRERPRALGLRRPRGGVPRSLLLDDPLAVLERVLHGAEARECPPTIRADFATERGIRRAAPREIGVPARGDDRAGDTPDGAPLRRFGARRRPRGVLRPPGCGGARPRPCWTGRGRRALWRRARGGATGFALGQRL